MKYFLLNSVEKIESRILEGDFPKVKDFLELLNAPEVHVNDRTVRRYIKFMREYLNLPLKYDSHKKGFFYTNTNKTLKAFINNHPEYLSNNLVHSSDIDSIKNRDELLNIIISNVTSKGLSCDEVDEETKAHIRSTEKNLKSCKTVEEILLYYDFSLKAKTGNEVASVLQKNNLLCFESPEISTQVDKFRK